MDAVEKKFGRRYRLHDVWASFITQMAKTVGPVAAQHLARHADFATTQAYIEVSDTDMREGANRAADQVASKRPSQKFLTEEAPVLKFKRKVAQSLVGAAGFEPTTPSPPDWCANQAAPRSVPVLTASAVEGRGL
jgi:hypothetical protein